MLLCKVCIAGLVYLFINKGLLGAMSGAKNARVNNDKGGNRCSLLGRVVHLGGCN